MSRIRPALHARHVPGARARPWPPKPRSTILMSGSTSVYPLSTALAQGYAEEVPEDGQVPDLPGRLGHRHRRRRPQARGDRRLLARPAERRSRRPGVQQDRPRRRVRRHAPRQRDREPLPAAGPGHLLRPRRAAGTTSPGAKVTGPINLNVRTQASGTQDAFRNIFMGQSLNVAPSASQKSTNGLVQAAVAQRPAGDRLRRLQVHRAARTRSRTRASPATCATPSPASTRASATSGSSRSASRRARPRSSSTSRARLPCRAASSRRTTCPTSSARRLVVRPPHRPAARRSGRAGPARDRGDGGLRHQGGVAVVLGQRAWRGSARAATRTSSCRRSSPRASRSSTRCAPGRCCTAPRSPSGGAVVCRARALDARGAVRRRVRAAARWRARSSPSCGCWPACRPSSTA